MLPDYIRRFGGIERLYGTKGLIALQQAHICTVGVGGVGSWAVEALARSGIGELTLIDLDHIAVSNVNRQLHALTPDFGKAKVIALQERIALINPHCQVNIIEDFVELDNINIIFRQPYDFVIDAIDVVKVKAAMADYFIRSKQAFIISGGAGGQRNPALIKQVDLSQSTHDALLSNLRYTLRKQYGFSRTGKMKVPCIYSSEPITPPQQTENCQIATNTAPRGLSCAGYGASMLVTASFGLHCATAAIEHILKHSKI